MGEWWAGDTTRREPGAELDSLRRAVAELLDTDQETWPAHGNAPLAIAAAITRFKVERDQLRAALTAQGEAEERLAGAAKLLICGACGERPDSPAWRWAYGDSYRNGHIVGGPVPDLCGPVVFALVDPAPSAAPVPYTTPCPECEGRGFTRQYIDGARESDKCSWCHGGGVVPSAPPASDPDDLPYDDSPEEPWCWGPGSPEHETNQCLHNGRDE